MIRAMLIAVLLCGPAQAALTQAELDRVAVDLPSGSSWPLGLEVPAVLIFADFNCGHLCDAILGQTADLLAETGLAAGQDYRLVVVGMDPRDSADMAVAFISRETPADLRAAVTIVRPDAAQLKRMTDALGYGYVRDEDEDRFAHPAARYILAADGKVTAVLPAFGNSVADLRAALVGARFGTGAAATRLILLCYGLDPVTGRYSLAIWRVLTGLSVLTMIVVGAGLGIAFWRERRRI